MDNRGWKYESARHSLASRGIRSRSTSRKKRETITEVIRRGLRMYDMNPRKINIGDCDWFACEVVRHVPGAEVRMNEEYEPWLPGMHFWVYYRGKHYDPEASEGVSDPWDLPFYKRLIKRYGKYKVKYVGLR